VKNRIPVNHKDHGAKAMSNLQDQTDQSVDLHTETQNHASARQPGWLWVSAGILAALIVVQGAGRFESTAHAGMANTSGSYAIATTKATTDDVLLVIDSRDETLMVYRTFANNELRLLEREDLAALFSRARARAIGKP
jgi:hypothetical protein